MFKSEICPISENVTNSAEFSVTRKLMRWRFFATFNIGTHNHYSYNSHLLTLFMVGWNRSTVIMTWILMTEDNLSKIFFFFWSCYFYFQQWLLWGLGVKSRCDLKVPKIEHGLKIFLSFQVLCKHSFEIKFICFHLKSKSWQPMSWNKLMPLH